MEVDRRRVIAYRVARHGLHRDASELRVLDLGVQDAGARSPYVALAARLPGAVDADLVTVWTFRGAPHLIRRSDVGELAANLWPRGSADALARLGGAGTVFRKAGIDGLDALTRAATAMREVVTEATPRGHVSTEVTRLLPADYSYDCRSCASTHIYGSLFQLVGLFAGVEVRNESRPTLLRPLPARHPVPTVSTGATPLIESYLRLHGPATVAHAAGFLDTTQAQTTLVWPEDLVPVTVEGTPRFLRESDLDDLLNGPDPAIVRLLPPSDPLLQCRDRETLVPAQKHRKEVWKVIGNPGVVLVNGEITGTWRTKTAGKTLRVQVFPFGKLPASTTRVLNDEAERVATARGLPQVTVDIVD